MALVEDFLMFFLNPSCLPPLLTHWIPHSNVSCICIEISHSTELQRVRRKRSAISSIISLQIFSARTFQLEEARKAKKAAVNPTTPPLQNSAVMETASSAAVLLLDLPPSALAGIDLLSFTVTPRFRGVKDLPSGFHFAFAGTTTAFSERHGLWFHTASSQTSEIPLFITKWNGATETLDAETDNAEKLRWRANLGSLWREGLTPYRQSSASTEDGASEELQDWPALTSEIKAPLLSRITGGDDSHWYLSSASSARRDLEDIPGLNETDRKELQSDCSELNFLTIDFKQTWRQGAMGRERTDAAQDRSWALENVVRLECTNGDFSEVSLYCINISSDISSPHCLQVIGELQFTFLMILTLNNFSCLEQWRRLLELLLTCKSAVLVHPDLYIRTLSTLRLQLQHCKDAEGGLIDLAEESGSLLKTLLARFRKGLESLPPSSADIGDVMDELDDLYEYLRGEHGWTFGGDFLRSGVLELEDGEQVQMDSTAYDEDDETGEFAPQIVDLTPDQARLLGVSPEDARDLGMRLGNTSLRDSQHFSEVVQESGSDDDEEQDRAEVGETAGGASGDESEEEMQDLEDMDSRY